MQVRNIMTKYPNTASPNDTVSCALDLMITEGFHYLPILSKHNHLIGIVSLRDCRIALNQPHFDENMAEIFQMGNQVLLGDIMTTAPIVTTPEMDVFRAAMLMYENNINSLPVMLEETLIGIITSSDILVACIHLTQKRREPA